MNIIRAITDKNLFRPFLAGKDGDISSWYGWMAALRALYGLPVPHTRRELLRKCTGRDYQRLPKRGFDTALLLTGRRSGKSRTAAIVGAFEAVLAGHETKLARGEKGIVAICAPTKSQGRIVKGYLRAIFEAPMLADQIAAETREGFELHNRIRIEILAGDFRSVRGFTLVAAIVDEAAFFGHDAESRIKSDTELVRAIQPSLATTGGKLVAISTPYAKRGWCFNQHTRNFGNDAGKVLLWNCPSRTMNPSLRQSIVDDALAEDLQAARSEYLGEFRDDIAEYLSRAVIENLVAKGRKELLPRSDTSYVAFCDVSGGRGDGAGLAIAHREDRKVILDLLRLYRPPFNPYEVVGDMAEIVKRFGLRSITGDNYSAEFVARAFQACGIRYLQSDKPKSQLYVELLPRLCSSEIELLDNETLISQLASLERRTRAGGRDVIDHPPGGHDDLANAVAGVAVAATRRQIFIGAVRTSIGALQ